MNGPDYILDISSLKPRDGDGERENATNAGGTLAGRPWLAVRWKCCSVYSRVYRNAEGTRYEGRCPRCGKQVKAVVGEGGTSERFFEAG